MAEYIEREAALQFVYDACAECMDACEEADCNQCMLEGVKLKLRDIPAADVRPVVRGKWIDDKGNPIPWDELNKNCPAYGANCSVCGEWLTASDEYPVIGNFCPNCGADMREES